MVSLNEAVKFSIFSPITPLTSCPPPATGWATPILVPSAMAAMCADIVMNTPAEPAPGTAGSDVDDHRNRGGEDFFDDRACRTEEPAGSIELNDQGSCPV